MSLVSYIVNVEEVIADPIRLNSQTNPCLLYQWSLSCLSFQVQLLSHCAHCRNLKLRESWKWYVVISSVHINQMHS